MLPATIFRSQMCSSFCSAEQMFGNSAVTGRTNHFVNCLNRYVAATGFIRISFLDINQRRNWDLANLKNFANAKKECLHLRTLQSRHMLQHAIERRREIFIERKNVIAADIREVKHKVKERVREKIERENIITIPNILTVGRAILSPYIGYVIVQGDFMVAMYLLSIAGVTDLLDGQIARRWPSQASKFGSFLDPMADKLLMGSLAGALCYSNLLPLWLTVIVLWRDVFLVGAGFVIRYISLPPPKTLSRYFDASRVTAQLEPTLISKINTGVQLLTIGASLGAPIWGYLDHSLLHGLWYLTGATTVAAALSYIVNSKNTFKIIAKSAKNPQHREKTT